jgi:hypothetical protein
MNKTKNTDYYIDKIGSDWVTEEDSKEMERRLKRLDWMDGILGQLNPRLAELTKENEALKKENAEVLSLIRNFSNLHSEFLWGIKDRMRNENLTEIPIRAEYKQAFDAAASLVTKINQVLDRHS